MWRPLITEIITKRFITLSLTIRRTSPIDCGLRTLLCLLTLLVATPSDAQANDDNIPRINSWRLKYTEDLFESVYLGYGGNPWGTSSPAIRQRQDPRVSLQTQSVQTPSNNSKPTEIPTLPRVSSSLRRSKRGVIHLYNMVVCATGCNPLAYKGYGCYCGFLGSGFSIDGIDRCCKMHDWCYEATDCPMFLEYFVPYYWKCYRGNKPICAVQHGDWGGSGSCAQRLCECDRALAECLRRYPCPTTKAMCTSSPWRLVQNLFMLL